MIVKKGFEVRDLAGQGGDVLKNKTDDGIDIVQSNGSR